MTSKEALFAELEKIRDDLDGMPNTDFTRMMARSRVSKAFHEYSKALGNEPFLFEVICDDRNNSPATIMKNELRVDINLSSDSNLQNVKIIAKTDVDIDVSTAVPSHGGYPTQKSTMPTSSTTAPIPAQPSWTSSGPSPYTVSGTISHNTGMIATTIGGIAKPIETSLSGFTPSTSADLPQVKFFTHDDHQLPITLTLQPESTISTHELLKLMLLIQAASTSSASAFSVYQFVKKNNLERHFKFTQ